MVMKYELLHLQFELDMQTNPLESKVVLGGEVFAWI